jgi:uncharacterized protein (DUF1501 family)
MSSKKDPKLTSRRDFVRQASCAAVGTWALKNTIRDLRLINAAAGQSNLTGYKALVCIFLAGGNDANNWIVPMDTTTFDQYSEIRGNLALPKSSLLPMYSTGTTPYVDADGHSYGFHPSSSQLRQLFSEDKLAVVMNVGTLVRPTTKADYNSGLAAYRPPQLFSHSDQVTQWQTSIPDQPPATGWGGRVADLLNDVANPAGNISMSVSVNGANTFQVGNLVAQYQVSTGGAVTLSGNLMTGTTNNTRARTMKEILGLSHANLQRTAYADVVENAIVVGDLLNNAVAATALDSYWTTPFPQFVPGTTTTSQLSAQLKMVARLIHARATFGMNRQIFFCGVGGYDTHTSQVLVNGVDDPTNTNGAHYRLLAEVSQCVNAFQRAMEQLNIVTASNPVALPLNSVTAFTASDFSRTLPTNSQGSDHGWGSHHLIVGGAVKGGQTYGNLPIFSISGPNDTGLGRWIPTLAVDQYSATLAKWFGVDPGSNMAGIFPNLSRFPTADLGFML